MFVLRYIAILILNVIFFLHSGILTVSALVVGENSINSIEELQVQANLQASDTMSVIERSLDPSFHKNISTLIASHVEYNSIELNTYQDGMSADFISNNGDIFWDFIQSQESEILTGEKNKKIRVDRLTKRTKNIE